MGSKISRYTLNAIIDEKKVVPIAKGSLEEIDKITIGFKDKDELIEAIKDYFDIELVGNKIDLSITYNQNKKTRNVKILYSRDKDATDKKLISKKVIEYSVDKNFVISFVKRYCDSIYLSNLAREVIALASINGDYMEPLQRIVDIAFDNYKAIRDIYPFLKKYEKSKKNDSEAELQTDLNDGKDLLRNLKVLKSFLEYQQLNFFDKIDFDLYQSQKNGNNDRHMTKKLVIKI